MRWVTRAFAFAVALTPAEAEAAARCGTPTDLCDGWTAAAPEQESLDPALICCIGPRLEKLADADPNGVVIARHGVLAYEHYFTGGDENARLQHDANTLHDVHSITKSVTALLTGIAFNLGWLKSLNASIFSFPPQCADLRTSEKDRITLRDLLTMTPGLAWPELAVPVKNSENIDRRIWNASDPHRFLLSQPLAATPGTVWNYNSGAVDLLGVILQKASGQPLDQFAKEALFAPLEVTDWQWGNPSNGLISGWTISLRGKSYSYGYLWLGRETIGSRNIDWVGGLGWGGQRLFVVPTQDLVVVATAYVIKPEAPSGLAGGTALDMVLGAAMHGGGR